MSAKGERLEFGPRQRLHTPAVREFTDGAETVIRVTAAGDGAVIRQWQGGRVVETHLGRAARIALARLLLWPPATCDDGSCET